MIKKVVLFLHAYTVMWKKSIMGIPLITKQLNMYWGGGDVVIVNKSGCIQFSYIIIKSLFKQFVIIV